MVGDSWSLEENRCKDAMNYQCNIEHVTSLAVEGVVISKWALAEIDKHELVAPILYQ